MLKNEQMGISLQGNRLGKFKKIIKPIVMIVFMLSFTYILLYPIFYMLSNALKTSADYINPTVQWVPQNFTFENFKTAFIAMNYWNSLKNTIVMEIVSAFLSVFFCSVYAYGLSRFKFRFRNVLIFVLILIIMVPDVMVIIPRVENFRRLDFLGILGFINRWTGKDLRPNILNTLLPFYLPSIFGVGLKSGIYIYIYMQFFKGLPGELEEAAWIDGAGPLRTFLQIIVPSSTTVFMTVLVFSLVWHWNDYYLAMLYTSDTLPMAVVLMDIRQHIFISFGEANGASPLIFGAPPAACLLYIAPIILIYMFLQKFFVESIDRVGIVG